MSMMVSFVLSFFPRDVLDEILNLIESVSEDFPSYSYLSQFLRVFLPTLFLSMTRIALLLLAMSKLCFTESAFLFLLVCSL